MRKIFFILFIAILFSGTAGAQDRIYRQNGKIVEAKIIEIGSSEIKYREFNNADGPVYVLETDRVKKIVFANGTEQKFGDNMADAERYGGQRTKALKVNFLSPLYGYTEIGFEKSVGVGKSFELSLGVIGAGKAGVLGYYNNNFQEVKRKPKGFFVSGGYKFGKLPDFVLFGKTRQSHIMQGTYIKPVVYVGHYSEAQIQEKANNTFETGRQQVTFGAVQIELGRQWVFSDRFLLDMYWGIGYGFDNKENSIQYYDTNMIDYYYDASAFNYANARGGASPGLSGTFGIKIGWLLGDKAK